MKGPTERQLQVLAFVSDYIHEHAYPPTIREMAEHFGISVKGAHDHVTALKKKGLLRCDDGKSRTMEVVKPAGKDLAFTQVPILGTVAAGQPILAEENLDGTVSVPWAMLKKNRRYFALRVRGDSMTGAGIMDGDMAVIEQQNVVNNGEIAVVDVDNAVTLKRFFKEPNRVRLQPENAKYKPIFCRGDFRVLGRLAHILRSYDAAC